MDDQGRVQIPEEIREVLGLTPGRGVILYEEAGEVRIHPQLTPEAFIQQLCGVINEETRAEDADPIDPLEIKRIWEPRV